MIRSAVLASCMLVLASCSMFRTPYELDEVLMCPAEPVVSSIAVLPFDVPAGYPDGLVVEGGIEDGAVEKLAGFVTDALAAQGCFRLVGWEESVGKLRASDRGSLLTRAYRGDRAAIRELCAFLRTDAVLVGYVTRYQDRLGRSYGIEKPASVAFQVMLVSGTDGSPLWRAGYRETQQPLSENLLNVGLYARRGFSWLTADELARWGAREAVRKIPGGKR